MLRRMTEMVTEVSRYASDPMLHRLADMSEQQYGRRAVETGPTGKTVAENLARLRKARGLSIRQLSAALEARGRSLSPSGITRMEKAERHVTADELVALAVALGASPQALLLPLRDDPAQTIEITGAGAMPADQAWEWMPPSGQPLRRPEGIDVNTALLQFIVDNWPPNAYRRMRDVLIGRFDAMATDGPDATRRRDEARRLADERQVPPIGEFVMREDGADGPSVD
jgi:transcriptional regulator with XRE-family HTH domain